jgi:SAM-dependent methyltransferase
MPEQSNSDTAALAPQMLLYQIGIGHFFSRALALAAKLRIADEVSGGPKTGAEIAHALDMHAPSLVRVMRLLVSVGVFTERDDCRFALNPLSELLRSDIPGSMRSFVLLFAGVTIQDSWKELEYCVHTGDPAFRRFYPDDDAFSFMARNPEQAAVFDEAMAAFAPMTSAALAASYDFGSFGKIVDVGGGNGALMIGLLNANPKLHGIVFDRSEAAGSARKKLAEAGLAKRCEVVAGDFFKDVPQGGRAYMLKHIIHDWNDDRAVAILKNCRRAMPADGTLLIIEGVYPSRIEQSEAGRRATATDVNMLVSAGGRQRSEAEFRAILKASGFRLERIVPTPARASVIESSLS